MYVSYRLDFYQTWTVCSTYDAHHPYTFLAAYSTQFLIYDHKYLSYKTTVGHILFKTSSSKTLIHDIKKNCFKFFVYLGHSQMSKKLCWGRNAFKICNYIKIQQSSVAIQECTSLITTLDKNIRYLSTIQCNMYQ